MASRAPPGAGPASIHGRARLHRARVRPRQPRRPQQRPRTRRLRPRRGRGRGAAQAWRFAHYNAHNHALWALARTLPTSAGVATSSACCTSASRGCARNCRSSIAAIVDRIDTLLADPFYRDFRGLRAQARRAARRLPHRPPARPQPAHAVPDRAGAAQRAHHADGAYFAHRLDACRRGDAAAIAAMRNAQRRYMLRNRAMNGWLTVSVSGRDFSLSRPGRCRRGRSRRSP